MNSTEAMHNAAGSDQIACWICGGRAQPDERLASAGYLRCTRCGLLFQGRRPAGAAAAMYDESYFPCCAGGGGYLDDDAQRFYEARRRVRFLRRFVKQGRLLEVGSAGGHFLEQARRAGFEVRGIEPVASAATRSAARFGLDVEHATLERSELPNGVFDVVCAFHVLEHLQDPLPALTKIRAALTDAGTIIIEVPNIESVLAKRRGDTWFNLQASHHVAHYGPASLGAALQIAGYAVHHSTTVPAFEYTGVRKSLNWNTLAAVGSLFLASRRPSLHAHPDRHEFLRAVARKSDARPTG